MTNDVVEKKELSLAEKQAIAESFIEKAKAGWAEVLPKICTPDRFARVALSCLKGDNKILDVISTKEGQLSILKAFKTCAELGIEPDGRRAR